MKRGELVAQALYRKYRSKTLDEIVGQQHVTTVLSRALKQGKLSHAYLLTGPRGVGKTSIARILAHEINQLPYTEESSHLDIIEIDAASNNGVDDVRDLREKVQITPVSAAKKIYIIDEVHMLSKQAFNALLKTLEEPPEHVVFILATTDAHKVPDTILSRTQTFTFRTISSADVTAHLRTIADKEAIAIDDAALSLIAEHGEGSFRDSISLLDQLASLSAKGEPITAELVEQVVGLAPQTAVNELIDAYLAHDQARIITGLDTFESTGIDTTTLVGQLITALRGRITEDARLLELLQALLDVLTSPRPDIALATTLLAPSVKPHKSAAEAVVVAPELQPLAMEATAKKPSEQRVAKKAAALPQSKAAPVAPAPAPVVVEAPAVEAAPKPKKPAVASAPFSWDTYLAHFKESSIALYSILAKCKHELEGDTLNIYTGTAFWKKKLDDSKYQPLLHQGVADIGAGELTIETIPTQLPIKDSQAAAVAAIMGGGEEVSLEEDS